MSSGMWIECPRYLAGNSVHGVVGLYREADGKGGAVGGNSVTVPLIISNGNTQKYE